MRIYFHHDSNFDEAAVAAKIGKQPTLRIAYNDGHFVTLL
jgi:hypothetical protein